MAGNPQATRREWAFGNEAVIWPRFWSMHLCFAPQNTRLLLQTHKMCSRRQKYGCGHRCLRRLFICSCLSLLPGWRTTSYFCAASHVRATPTLLLMRKTDGVHRLSSGSIGWSCPHLVVERCTVHFRSHCERRTRSKLKRTRCPRMCSCTSDCTRTSSVVCCAHGSRDGRGFTVHWKVFHHLGRRGCRRRLLRRGCRRGWRGLRALRRFTR